MSTEDVVDVSETGVFGTASSLSFRSCHIVGAALDTSSDSI